MSFVIRAVAATWLKLRIPMRGYEDATNALTKAEHGVTNPHEGL